jgi:hypothetical protein
MVVRRADPILTAEARDDGAGLAGGYWFLAARYQGMKRMSVGNREW